MRRWILCVAVAWPLAVLGAPRVTPQSQYKAAAAQYGNGNYDQALALIAQGLAAAPKDVSLLRLRATVLLELRNYPEALAAYEALLAAGARGADRLQAEEIAKKLRAVRSTFLDIAFTNGPAAVYLDSKSLGMFCAAGPSCRKAVLPNQYTVIAERPGFERWTDRVTVESGQTKQLSITLIEKPSRITVQVEPAGAEITIDGAPFDTAKPTPAGRHVIAAALDRHRTERREIEVREGKPVELALTLVPLVAIRVEPAGATLLLDGRPASLTGGALALTGGAHELFVRAPGFQDRKLEIPAERPTDYAIEVKLAPAVSATAPSRFTRRRKLALVASGIGLVAVSTGVALGVQSRNLDDDASALCPSPADPCAGAAKATDLNRQARLRALQANVAYGVAGGAALAAAILWLTGSPEARQPRSAAPRATVLPLLGTVTGLHVTKSF